MEYTPLEQKIVVIGDITVNADDDFVQVAVDDNVALFISRDKNEGLGDLVTVLNNLIK